jgi:hypothetical protein
MLVKCPHCASIVEYGVLVCYGCGAEVRYGKTGGGSREERCVAGAIGGFFIGLVVAFVGSFGIWKQGPDHAPQLAFYALLAAGGLGGALLGLLAGSLNENTTKRTIIFRRRYPEDRVLETTITVACFAAIAYSPSLRCHGHSHGYVTQEAAESAAVRECAATDATVVVWTRDAWCALAVADDGAYGAGWAGTSQEACQRSLAECQKHTTSPAHIALCISS